LSSWFNLYSAESVSPGDNIYFLNPTTPPIPDIKFILTPVATFAQEDKGAEERQAPGREERRRDKSFEETRASMRQELWRAVFQET
jgi:hypothetical protein